MTTINGRTSRQHARISPCPGQPGRRPAAAIKGQKLEDWALAIGLRSNYDRSLAVQPVVGSRVFVCDNLAFSGEVQASRKHTMDVFRDLPDLIYRMLAQVSVFKARQAQEIDGMKAFPMDDPLAHHMMIMCVRRQAIPASRLPKVLEAWEQPTHEEFQRSAADQMDSGLRLTQALRDVLALSA